MSVTNMIKDNVIYKDELEEWFEEELTNEEIVDKLDAIVRGKKPCNDYIFTLGTMMAIKEADRTTNIFERINTFYIKAVSQDFKYFNDNMILDLDQKNAVNDIGIYLASNK